MVVETLVNVFFAILFGMAFGSFATMAQYRLPRNKPWSSVPLMKGERIHCPHCKHVLEFKDWCPVVGYVKNRGKCKFCSAKISPYYLFTEFGCTLVSVANVLLYGFEQQYVPMTLFGCGVVVMIVTALEYKKVPERIIVWLLFAAMMHKMLITQDMQAILITAIVGVMAVMGLDKLHRKHTGEPYPLEHNQLLALAGVALPLMLLPVFFGVLAVLMHITTRITSEKNTPYAVPILLSLFLVMYIPAFNVSL